MPDDDVPVTLSLQAPDIHDGWIRAYRTADNEPFYEWAFDRIAQHLGPPSGTVLDAGCGTGTKTRHLLARGYVVHGVDVGASTIDRARQDAPDSRASFAVGDLTHLTYPDGHFAHVVCWGVLMHIPDVTAAVRELARVTARGGCLVISENNQHSWHYRALALTRRLLRPGRKRDIRMTPQGRETWEQTAVGPLVTRDVNPRWLIAELVRCGFRLVSRQAGEWTQSYTVIPWRPVRWLIHRGNAVWYRSVRIPYSAQGQLFVFRRPGIG